MLVLLVREILKSFQITYSLLLIKTFLLGFLLAIIIIHVAPGRVHQLETHGHTVCPN